MCLAIPGKVKKVKGNIAYFHYQGHEYECDVSLAGKVKTGDWVLMHDGRVLSKISEQEAKENLKFIKENEEMNKGQCGIFDHGHEH